MAEQFDIVVIGSGPGGYRAAVLAALRGKRVAIIERHSWGGCCLNRGCVPKRAWHYSADLIAASRRFGARGIGGHLGADLHRAWQHQKTVVATVRKSYLDYMQRLGISAYAGTANLRDTHHVRVVAVDVSLELEAGNIIIATGSVPHLPRGVGPVPGRVLTTDMLFDQPPPPGKRVVIVGAGIVGVEFAYILSMLGREVRWIASRAPLSTSLFSAPARENLMAAFKEHGIEPLTGRRLAHLRVGGSGVILSLDDGGVEVADWVLLGTGRVPCTDQLGLDRAGVEVDGRRFVKTDRFLRTTAANIYAIGDCASAQMTANQALAGATVAIDNIVSGNRTEYEPLWTPEVVYSAMELARIGLNEDLAEDRGLEPAIGFTAFEASPCALGQGDNRGFVRLIADMDSGALLGGEVVGSGAGELIHVLAAAPDQARTLRWLAKARVNHPARAEEFLNATETLARRWGLAGRIFGEGGAQPGSPHVS